MSSIAENNSQVDVDELIEALPEPGAGLGRLERVDGLSTVSTIGRPGGLSVLRGKTAGDLGGAVHDRGGADGGQHGAVLVGQAAAGR